MIFVDLGQKIIGLVLALYMVAYVGLPAVANFINQTFLAALGITGTNATIVGVVFIIVMLGIAYAMYKNLMSSRF